MKHLFLLAIVLIFTACSSTQKLSEDKSQPPNEHYQNLVSQYSSKAVSENFDEIFNKKNDPTEGRGPIKIVYFFDYNCGHCKRQHEIFKEVLAKRSDVQIIYKNFAILGLSSVRAARAAIAASKQSRFAEYTDELFNLHEKSSKNLKALAQKLGMNMVYWDMYLNSTQPDDELNQVYRLAEKLQLTGTPVMAMEPNLLIKGRADELLDIINTLHPR